MKHLNVVAAIVKDGEKTLCVQRNIGKYDYISFKWEFPGGKIEPEETKENALKREILEELNLEIRILHELIINNHTYPDFEITMTSYICEIVSGELELKDHIAFEWLTNDKLLELDWAAADLPIVNKLLMF